MTITSNEYEDELPTKRCNLHQSWSNLHYTISFFSFCFYFIVMGSNFEITFISEKNVVEDNVLFTNHLVGK